MPGFPDAFAPFYKKPPGTLVSSTISRQTGSFVSYLRKFTQRKGNKTTRWHKDGSVPSGWANVDGSTPATVKVVGFFSESEIISTFDDYFSWLVTFLPVLTGIVATSHLGARYETLLGLHILSVALLLVWLPFGKLMHWFLAFVTRSQTGAHLSHRGAQL